MKFCCREITIDNTNLRVYPSGSVWRKNVISKKWSFVKGAINRYGHLSLRINKKSYLIHRLVAHAYFGFDLSSPLSIDHRDRNPMNNGVWNLRVVSHKENLRNTSAKGASKRDCGFRGSIYSNGIQYQKSFKTEEEALEWYKEMKKIHHVIPEPDYKKIMSMCLRNISE